MALAVIDRVVIYTGNAGNPATEFRASDSPHIDKAASFTIDIRTVDGVPGNYLGVWYVPYDDIRVLPSFATIAVDLFDANNIQLRVAGFGDSNTRMRLRIYVLTDA